MNALLCAVVAAAIIASDVEMNALLCAVVAAAIIASDVEISLLACAVLLVCCSLLASTALSLTLTLQR